MLRIPLALLAGLALPAIASAGSLSPWGTQTADGETWLTPYMFVDSGSASNNTYLSIGLGGRFDIIGGVGVGVGFEDGFAPGVVEAMPRFFISDNVGLVVRVGSVPGMTQLEIGPEIHAAWQAGALAFTTNVGWRPTLGAEGGTGSAFGVFAPELFVTDGFSVYTEVNPSVDLTSGDVALTVVPGVGLAIGDHSFSVGVMLPTDDPAANYVAGGWYSVRIGATSGS